MMSKWQKYPAYKDSGIEWLGEIPEEWELIKLGHFFKATKGSNAAKLTKEYCAKIQGKYNVYSGQTENNGVMDSINTYEFDFEKQGCLFTTTVGAKAMTLNYLEEKFNLSQNCMIMFSNKNDIYNKFYFYHLQPLFAYERQLIPDHMQPSFRMEDFYQFNAVLPPKQEQEKIASFLDKKTSQIDKAINQKEKLIKLLKEYRQIIINEAVTKGVDENGKLRVDNGDFKDSGIEWIGKIPRNWNVKKLKFVLTINNGQDYKKVISDEGYPVIGSGGQFAYANQYLYDGEVLLLGRKGTVDKPLYFKGKFWTVDTMFYGVSKQNNNTKFLYYSSLSIPFKFYSTSTALPSMTQFDLNNHKIAIPPKQEQEKIVKYIENQTTKIDKALHLQQSYIEKLKEYKATLIDSVVTGKVRVK